MFKNYFKIAWRSLVRSKAYSIINIGGLAVGMAITMLISLWVYDETSYNTYFKNYNSITGCRVIIQNKYLVDFCHVRNRCVINNINHYQLSINKGSSCKPGEEFENGMKNVNGESSIVNKTYSLKLKNL